MQPTLKEGTRFGSYEIVQPLGSGGMGEVYLARDVRLDRQVAIKIIAPSFAGDPERLDRFVREAKTASSLNHPNIAHVYEIGEWEGVHFIVMEYVRGEALNSRIGSRGMPIADVIVYATQIADALDEAHNHGIVHRDLKPANAMITTRGKLKILDFGLAKVVAPSGGRDSALSTMAGDTMAGLVLGTLDYMSPEQVRGLEVDQRSDIFSFGVMLYEMITGRLPFASTSKTDTVYRITQRQPEAVTRYNYEVPADLDRIVRKCLEKEPGRRYQAVRELLVDLSSLRRDSSSGILPLLAAPTNPRRKQWLAGGALVLVGAMAAAGAIVWLRPDVIDSLVVIPGTTSSAGQQALELTDGVAASLGNSLSQLAGLNVAPRQRTSGDARDPQETASGLGVHGVLVVRVVMRGETAVVDLELVDALHPKLVWGQQYTLRLSEIELAQESISAEVADTLRLRFNAAERRAQDVFHLYQRGQYHARKRTETDIRRAIEFYQLAIDKDRSYAKAWAGLAEAYNLLGIYTATPPLEVFPNAKAAAEQALKLDDTLAEAHTQIGLVFFRWTWDLAAAEREFTRAMALNQNYAEGQHWAGMFLTAMGRFDEAMTHLREAQVLDPLSPLSRAVPGWTLYMARQYEQAIAESQRARDADPTSVMPYRYLGLAHTQLGNFDRAIEAFQTAISLSGGSELHKAELAHALAIAGRRTEAMRILAGLHAGHPKTFVSAYNFAVISAGLGDVKGALDYLDTAVRERADRLVYAKVDPRLDPLRGEPRFAQLLKTLRLE